MLDAQNNLIELKMKLEQNESLIHKKNSSLPQSNKKSSRLSDSFQSHQIKEKGFSTPINNK